MTPVVFKFQLPDGEVCANAPFTITLRRAGFLEADSLGISLPDTFTAVTDENGTATVELAPLNQPYYLTMVNPRTPVVEGDEDAPLQARYRFIVPVSATPVQIEYLLVTDPTWSRTWDEVALEVIVDGKAAAIAAADRAEEEAARAETKAETAEGAAETANLAAQAAGSSEAAAQASEEAAHAAHLASDVARDAAANSAAAAAASVTAAQGSEDVAKAAEVNAKASADAAKASETKAKASEDTAKASETASTAAQADALVSKEASKASETAAKTSETNAKASETAAQASQAAASASETAANASATAASGSAAAALVSEGKAKTSETAAKTSENNAKASEVAAKSSEQAADSSKVAAKTSEDAAKASQTAAASSAATSLVSAQNADESEDNALDARDAAQAFAVNALAAAMQAEADRLAAQQAAEHAAQDAVVQFGTEIATMTEALDSKQPLHARLSSLASAVLSVNDMLFVTGADSLSAFTTGAKGRELLQAVTDTAARNALGLGTAAQATLTTSTTDTTVGRLLRVGDHGLGVAGSTVAVADCNTVATTGFYGFTSGTLNGPIGASSGAALINIMFSTQEITQIVVPRVSTARMYLRRMVSGVWGTWGQSTTEDMFTTFGQANRLWADAAAGRAALELGTAAQATLTTSVSDTTLGRVVKVGDFGLGATDIGSLNMPAGAALTDLTAAELFSARDPNPSDWPVTQGDYPMGINFYRSAVVRSQLAMSFGGKAAGGGVYWRAGTSGGFGTWARLLEDGEYGIGRALTLTAGANLNGIVTPGEYAFTSGTPPVHAPDSGAGFLTVIGRSDYPHQEWRGIYSNTLFMRSAKVYQPTLTYADWNDWIEVLRAGSFGVGGNSPLETVATQWVGNKFTGWAASAPDSPQATNACGLDMGYAENRRMQLAISTASTIMFRYSGDASGSDGWRQLFGQHNSATLPLTTQLAAATDNQFTLGVSARRWNTVFAATGTINTSDAREKTPVRGLTADEIQAAKLLGKEIGAYKWLASIQEKGDGDARLHIGMTVQRAIEIMEGCNLDPFAYGFICFDEWAEEVQITPAQYEEIIDEHGMAINGELITPEIRTVISEAGNRYSFRYDELNLFIAAGFEARLAALEAAA